MRALGRSAVAALRPGPNPLAVAAGLRTLVPAAAVAVVGALTGELQSVGVAYLGAACDFLASTGHKAVKAIAAAEQKSLGPKEG